ncbi:hypothetical protein O7A70_24025 [Mesorhizobium sp. Cs1299R1N1]|uniref:hypothetical protein n=1 Tax=Mesorhizobium sp. Cs1299R1N1 TaxID=3015172 RepID=UPI00301CC788
MKRSSLLAGIAIGLLALSVAAKSFASEVTNHSANALTALTGPTAPMAPAEPTVPTAPSDKGQDASSDATDNPGVGKRLLCFLRLGKCTDPRF